MRLLNSATLSVQGTPCFESYSKSSSSSVVYSLLTCVGIELLLEKLLYLLDTILVVRPGKYLGISLNGIPSFTSFKRSSCSLLVYSLDLFRPVDGSHISIEYLSLRDFQLRSGKDSTISLHGNP